ncbi:MAG TPA: hypothetical protein VK034_30535 [Enhygromyxa sp.]|nr:hypothetical protein [Enhygromyxa sp.]
MAIAGPEHALSLDDLEALDDGFAEEFLDDFAAVDPAELEAGEIELAPAPSRTRGPDLRPLPRATDWRGRKLSGAERTQQKPHYGRFQAGFPAGLCLHYPVSSVWTKSFVKQHELGEAFAKGVEEKTRWALVFARNTRTDKNGSPTHYNTYFIIDYLGGLHQDCNVDDKGIHGHSANKYTLGVEISCAGKLVEVGGRFYRSFDVAARQLKNPRQPSFPAWARRTVARPDGNIRPGTYALFTPAQVEAIFKLHADLMHLDGGRGIYRSKHLPGKSGVTSHDVHSDGKSDVGGSLFTNIETFGELLDAYVEQLLARGDRDLAALIDPELHAQVYEQLVLAREDYRAIYRDWRDEVPLWA